MIVIVINNSEMSDSSMESCSSEDDISSSEPRPVEVSKEGSGRGIGREKGSWRDRCIEVAVVIAYTIHKCQAAQGEKLTHLVCRQQLIEALSPSAPPKRGRSTALTVEKLQPVRQCTAKGESRLDCVVSPGSRTFPRTSMGNLWEPYRSWYGPGFQTISTFNPFSPLTFNRFSI